MGARVSHIFWWVRRADGTPRKADRLGACFDGLARRRLVRVPGDIDLSATDSFEMLDHPDRLETFSLETVGPVDLIPRLGRAATALADDE